LKNIGWVVKWIPAALTDMPKLGSQQRRQKRTVTGKF